jgi:hypothetical protein
MSKRNFTPAQMAQRKKLSGALNQLARDPREIPFDVFHHDGKRLGEAHSFSTAMILHVQALRQDTKRPELFELYAGVSERDDSYGQPLFFLEK